MVKVFVDVKGRELPCSIYLDGHLKSNLDTMHDLVERQWDNVGFICGNEGDGKSVFAMIQALYLDSGFNIDNIVFLPEQFEDAVDKAPPGTCIVWDEADDLASNWQNAILLAIKRKFKRIRSKQLHIILVTPTIFDVNKYFVIGRARYLIHIYASGLKRGFFRFFSREKKKKLYLYGKKEWNWNAAKPDFYGRFTKLPKGFPIDMIIYNKKKDEATHKIIEESGGSHTVASRMKGYRRECIKRLVIYLELHKQVKVIDRDLAGIFSVDRSTISADKRAVLGDTSGFS